MGLTPSFPYHDFRLGSYWIGHDIHAARKGLRFHFPWARIQAAPINRLTPLLDRIPARGELLLIYDPSTMMTVHVMCGCSESELEKCDRRQPAAPQAAAATR